MNTMSSKWLKSETIWVSLIALFTAISSEIKLIPFNGEHFRFGLGSITFLLLILIRLPKSVIRTGVITGLTVVIFRIFSNVTLYNGTFSDSLIEHYPAFLYYFVYVLLFRFLKVERLIEQPFKLGIIATFIEIIANSAEHIMRFLTLPNSYLGSYDWFLIVMVALLRSFFVVGVYSSIIMSEQRKRLDEQLTLGSDLYVETLYLQKMMNHIEQIMADSYDLYRDLKKQQLQNQSIRALHISQEIHEVKKDAQRIFSGLSNITMPKTEDVYHLSNIVEFVVTANVKYSEMLNKKIEFKVENTVDFALTQQIPLLAILNNVTANAIEAVEDEGSIILQVSDDQEMIFFRIQDTGKGIAEEDLDIIFEPGFTTKYNQQGVAATGIGLSHVQEIVQMLDGKIHVESPAVGTIFCIGIPRKNIQKGVE
ncbi:ATP-binding protein [Rummeliibacillus pycnus]|uniref:ATP-binding protein n=1 Tax=Rummeliibacillus pycnus TaxID=101070 RepID=UPI0037C8A78F